VQTCIGGRGGRGFVPHLQICSFVDDPIKVADYNSPFKKQTKEKQKL